MKGKEKLDQIVRGLDGVSTGKWCQFHPHYCEEAIGTSFSDWDTSHDLSAVHDGKRRRIASFKHADDAAHMDRCSPDAMREIAAYVRDLEERLAKAAEALERIATAAERIDTYYAEETGNQTPLDNGVIISTLIIGDELSLFLLGDLRRARTALTTIRRKEK